MQAWHQFIDYVLHDPIQLEVEQRLRLVDLDVAHGAVLAGLQVLHNTTFADCKEKRRRSGPLGPRHIGRVGQTAQRLAASLGEDRAGSGTLTGVETLCDGGGIHEVAGTQAADDVFIQVFDLHPDLLLRTHPQSLLTGLVNPPHLTSALPSSGAVPVTGLRPWKGGGENELPLRPAEGSAHSGCSLLPDSPDPPFPRETKRCQ